MRTNGGGVIGEEHRGRTLSIVLGACCRPLAMLCSVVHFFSGTLVSVRVVFRVCHAHLPHSTFMDARPSYCEVLKLRYGSVVNIPVIRPIIFMNYNYTWCWPWYRVM